MALGAAFVLVFLVLPNPLRIPQNNPQASAEYAPVPGDNEADQNSNFSQTNQGSSAGIGSGGIGEGAGIGNPPPPPPPQFVPHEKECVGSPPRQTEDRLSPPCVPFFNGENGGSTYTGVTKDSIQVAFYNDLEVKGDMNKAWAPSDEQAGSETSFEHAYLIRTIKAQLRYFVRHYQTYRRDVRVRAIHSKGGVATVCSQRTADSYLVRKDINPFASVHFGDGGQCFLESQAKDFKIPGFGLNADVPIAEFNDYHPYIWGFYPPQEVETKLSASFLCRVLKGQTARFAGDPILRSKDRSFGLIYPTADAARGPAMNQMGEQLIQYAKQECGMSIYSKTYSAGGQAQAPAILQDFSNRGITTVICYCVPVPNESTVSTMQNAAQAASYNPEWFWDGASRMFRAVWEKQYGNPNAFNFGVNYHWRNDAFERQVWYKAYQSEAGRTEPNTRFNFDIYHLFLNLFQGIQGAGPNLTPETVQRGMFTFAYTNRNNPYEPVGGYGPYVSQAVADYNFIDTAMGWWWDPRGTPPGGKPGDGCIRVMNGGKRYFAGEWPVGDKDLRTNDAPCSQDDTQLQSGATGF